MPSTKVEALQSLLANPDYTFIQWPNESKELCGRIRAIEDTPGFLGVDTETTGLDPLVNRVRLIQVATADFALVVDLDGWRSEGERRVDWGRPGLKELKALLESDRLKVLQNAAFDLNFLYQEGVVLGGPIFDTMIASKIRYNGQSQNKNDLGSVVYRALKVPLSKELQKSDWGSTLSKEMVQYSARDGIVLPRLVEPLSSGLKRSKLSSLVSLWDVFLLEGSCLKAIAYMQSHGFGFDREGAEALKAKLEIEAEEMKIAFCKHLDALITQKHPDDPEKWLPRDPDNRLNLREKDSGSIRKGTKLYKGFNPRSPQQAAARLEDAGVILQPNEKGVPSLDQNLLAFIRKDPGMEIVDEYMEWKKVETLLSHIEKLLDSIGPDGRIHCSYRQMGTDTGRLSASGPNLQQIPRNKEFRRLFRARPGYKIVAGDFSQVELRVAGELSGEEKILEAYRAGRDLHTETAALMTHKSAEEVTKEDRTSAKVCFSADTEVLTPEGWVALGEYSGQQVAQYVLPPGVELNQKVRKPGPGYVAGLPAAWDGNCGAIEFVEPLHYDSFFSDDVWHAEDRNVDVMATGNHEIFYLDAYGNAYKKPLVEVVQPRSFVAAGYVSGDNVLGVAESRLLAMVVADGSFKQSPGWVSLGFSKRRKIHRCQALLEEMEIAYTKAIYSNGANGKTTFFKFRLEEAPWIGDYVTDDKELLHGACMRAVDKRAYLCEAQYWDGTAIEGSARDRVIVGTTVKQTANVMQAMAVTAGIPCTVHAEVNEDVSSGVFYKVSYAFRTTPTWRVSWEPRRAPSQQVYCVQVPSGLILIRRNGKVCVQGNCNFGLLYGAGPATLQKQAVAQYGIDMELATAKELVEGFRSAYPRLYEWQQEVGQATTQSAFTKIGRRRILAGSRNDKYTTRINTQVQGTAGDIAKIAIANIYKCITNAPKDEAFLISMCHDELVLEVREDLAEEWAQTLKRVMEEAGAEVCQLVPIVAEVSFGDTWADAK